MIVDHLCYGLSGGAAAAALRIHEGLRRRGVDSRYWHAPGTAQATTTRSATTMRSATTGPPRSDADTNAAWQGHAGEHGDLGDPPPDESRHPLVWPKPTGVSSLGNRVSNLIRTARDLQVKLRHLRYRPQGFEYFSTGRLRHPTPWPASQLEGDVLVLHWIGKLMDYPTFFESLPTARPIVWVLHDMNPFTGGCHFASGCEGYTHQCGHCPQIAASGPQDISYQTLQMKRRLYARLNLHVVAPSRWLLAEAQRSAPMAGAASHRVIPYGLETDRLAPLDRLEARRALGLDPRARIVLFGAASSENRRKGFHCLLDAWTHLAASPTDPAGEPIQGLMFGAGQAPVFSETTPAIRNLGFIQDPDRLRLVYSASDLFVLPSLEDNLPQTGMEAMACGVPVVAFSAGGIPDYVRPGETGSLVPVGDSPALAAQIRRLLQHPDQLRQMGARAREMMVREYSQPIESARYLEFLQALTVASRGAKAA